MIGGGGAECEGAFAEGGALDVRLGLGVGDTFVGGGDVDVRSWRAGWSWG